MTILEEELAKVDKKMFPYPSKPNEDGEYIFYSNLMVCRSGAGWYIGRQCWVVDKYGGHPEPGSRESYYYDSKEKAETALQKGFAYRDNHENELLYRELGITKP